MPPLMTFDAYSVVTRALLTYLPEFTPHEVASVVSALAHGGGASKLAKVNAVVKYRDLSPELQTQLLLAVQRVFDRVTDRDARKITFG